MSASSSSQRQKARSPTPTKGASGSTTSKTESVSQAISNETSDNTNHSDHSAQTTPVGNTLPPSQVQSSAASRHRTAVADARQRCETMLNCLAPPMNKRDGKRCLEIATAAKRQRALFLSSPHERDTSKLGRNNLPLSEIDVLQQKHEPEFRQLIPCITEAIEACIRQHSELHTQLADYEKQLRTEDDAIAADDKHPKAKRERIAAYLSPYLKAMEAYRIYDTKVAPNIRLEDYIHRLAEYTYISPASLLGALILLDRMRKHCKGMLFSMRNIFKLFCVATRVSSKVVDLRTLNNKNFASVGGMQCRDINTLEEHFLLDLQFNLYISPDEFAIYSQKVEIPIAVSAGTQNITTTAGHHPHVMSHTNSNVGSFHVSSSGPTTATAKPPGTVQQNPRPKPGTSPDK